MNKKGFTFIKLLLIVFLLLIVVTKFNKNIYLEIKNKNDKLIYQNLMNLESEILIYTPEDLYNIRNNLSAHYKLANNIDLTKSSYKDSFETISNFNGTLDGNGYSIIELNINSNGLFSNAEDITIKNLTLVRPKVVATNGTNVGLLIGSATGKTTISNIEIIGNINLQGVSYVGGLVGSAKNIIFDNIKIPSTMQVNTTGQYAGGILGKATTATILNSYSRANVRSIGKTNDIFVGGLAGYIGKATIDNSYTTGVINTTQNYTGGLVGKIETGGSINNSYVSGHVSGGKYIGSLVGKSKASISNSYASSDVNGDTYVGGLVGYIENDITNSYASGNVSGLSYIGGLAGYKSGVATNVYALGNVKGNLSYVGGITGYNSGNINNGYSIGKVITSSSYNDQLFGFMNNGSTNRVYFLINTSKKAITAAGSKISTLSAATHISQFDFKTPWTIIDGETFPYLEGMMIDNKNFLSYYKNK